MIRKDSKVSYISIIFPSFLDFSVSDEVRNENITWGERVRTR